MINETIAAIAAMIRLLSAEVGRWLGVGGGDIIVSGARIRGRAAYASFPASSKEYFGIGGIAFSRASGYLGFLSASHARASNSHPMDKVGSATNSAVIAAFGSASVNHF